MEEDILQTRGNFNDDIKKHPFKFLKASYEAVEKFLKLDDVIIKQPFDKPISNSQMTFSIPDERDAINFNAEIPKAFSLNDFDFKFLGFDLPLTLESDSSFYYSNARAVTSISVKFGNPRVINGEISNLFTDKIEYFDGKFLRMIIPVEKEVYTTNIHGTSYTDKEVIYGQGLITLEIKDSIYNFYRHQDRITEKYYLIVDCLTRETFESFEKTANSIIRAFSLLDGNWYGGQRFILSSESETFEKINSVYYDKESSSIITNHKIINPFEFVNYMKANGEELKVSDNQFPDKVLSTMTIKLIGEEEVNRALTLILEGNRAMPPILKSCSYLVAIETLAGVISKNNKEFFKTIKNKDYSKDITKKFNDVVLEFQAKLSEQELKTLKNKVEFFNTPSNMDKIIKSFEFFRINLPEDLLKLLKTRNLFLHGKTPFDETVVGQMGYDLMLNSLRFQMLSSMLLLKYCGYSGHIKNLAAYRIVQDRKHDEGFKISESVYYRI